MHMLPILSYANSERHPLSASARLLDILEILQIILEELYAGGCGAGSVANIARTCRSLHGIALFLLWRRMNSLVPLFKTLPQDCWREVQYDQHHTTLRLNTATPCDLTRFQYYSRNIREFHWKNNGDFDYATLKHFLKQVPGTFCLLPQARSVSLHRDWAECIPHPKVLMGPLIQHLGLNVASTDVVDHADRFLLEVKHLCADPQSIRLDVSIDSCSFNTNFLHILKLLRLRVPDLRLTGPDFRALQSLDVHLSDIDMDTLDLFHRIDSTRFTKLIINLLYQPCEVMIRRLFEVLYQHYPALRHLMLRIRGPGEKNSSPPHIVTIDTLKPLLGLSDLATLSISGGQLFLDVDAFKTIIFSLPHLKSLHLVSKPTIHATVPLGALFYLAYSCPELEAIELSVNAQEDQSLVVPLHWQSCSKVKSLRLINSPIDDMDSRRVDVFRFLIHLFPQLHYVVHDSKGIRTLTESRWDHAWLLIGEFVTDYIMAAESSRSTSILQ